MGVFLTVPGGGAGARCDGAAPAVLAARRIHTYFDPQTGTSWIFGALPAVGPSGDGRAVGDGRPVVADVSRRCRRIRARSRARACPRGMRVLVASVPGAPEVLGVTATDARGEDVLRCEGGLCSP